MIKMMAIDDEQRILANLRALLPPDDQGAFLHLPTLNRAKRTIENKLATFKPDFCVVDAELENYTDGLTIIQILRSVLVDVPVVVLTKHVDSGDFKKSVLRRYTSIDGVVVESKNPSPTWEKLCQAAGIEL